MSRASATGEGTQVLADAALRYARRGWAVFPLKPRGKTPLTPRGFREATSDETRVVSWWRETPSANIGTVPGSVGLLAVDVDGPEAQRSAAQLGLLAEPTLTVLTARGCHLYFTVLPELELEEGVGRLGPGLDVRGQRGYTLLPPSVHETGAVYRFADPQILPAPLPPDALERLRPQDGGGGVAWRAAAVGDVIPEGQRDATLTSLAGTMRRRGMVGNEILAALREVNVNRCRPTLADEQVVKIAASVTRYQPAAAHGGGNGNGRGAVAPLRKVSPPTQPMHVARELVADLYTTSGGLVLRDHGGEFYTYNGSCWPELGRRIVRAAAYRWLEDAVYEKATDEGTQLVPWDPTRRKIDDVVDALRAVVLLDGDKPPLWTDGTTAPPAGDLVSVANGLLHVPTRTVHPHTPRYFNYHALPFPFDPTAPAPRAWLAFLSELWPEDPSTIATLQETFGYVLAGDTRQQKIFLFVGPRRGGKGTIGRVLTGLLGVHNVAAPTMASLATNFGLQPLIGKPLALISDARLSRRADTGVVVERLLSVSGEDSLTIDRKYRDPWTGRLPTRFLILTNELPRLSDSSGALASRFVLFILTRSFLGRENPQLTDELLAEASSILNWALEGVDRLNARGHFEMPTSAREAIQQLEDLSSPVSAFVRDHCTVGPHEHVDVDDLWAAWKRWCEIENRHPGSKALFGRDLKTVIPTLRKARPRHGDDREHVYEGVGRGSTMLWHGDHRDQIGSGHSGHGDRALYPPRDDGSF